MHVLQLHEKSEKSCIVDTGVCDNRSYTTSTPGSRKYRYFTTPWSTVHYTVSATSVWKSRPGSPSASGAKVSPLLHLQIEHLDLTSIDSKSITESDLPTFPGETLALLLQCALEVRKISSSSSAITRFSIRFIRTSNASSVKSVEFCQRLVWFSVAIDLKSRNKSPSIWAEVSWLGARTDSKNMCTCAPGRRWRCSPFSNN